MNRKTLIAGLVFAGLFVVAAVVLRSPEKGTRTGDGPRPFAKLAAADFDTLVITKDDKSTTLAKDGDKYRVTAPVDYPADGDTAKDAFEAVSNLEFGNIVTDQKSKHGEFEVGDKALRIAVKKGDKTLADFRLGKVANNNTLLRVEGKDEVWQAQGALNWKFDRDSTGWRDKAVTKFEENDAARIVVAAADGARIVVEKPGKVKQMAGAGEDKKPAEGEAPAEPNADEWIVKETTVKIDTLDKSIPQGIVNALYSFRTNDFVDQPNPAETGLDAPRLTVTVETTKGEKHTLLVGNKKGDEDFYVKKDGGEQVFLVKKYNLDRIAKRPVEFRDKTICNVPAGDIQQIDVAQGADSFTVQRTGDGDDAWKLVKPKGDLDTSKASSMTSLFAEWKATSFAEDTAPAATGLDKPRATIVAKSKVKGSGCQVKVGATTKDDQNYHVQPVGSPDIYLVPKWSLDRVLVKATELKKQS